jgi:hypothetical protein
MLRLWFLIVSAMPSPIAIGAERRVPHAATKVMTGGAGQGWIRRAAVVMRAPKAMVVKETILILIPYCSWKVE